MNLLVEYKDDNGVISNRTYNMSRLAFAKHFAIAGQRYAPTTKKFFRTLGMFFHYNQYLKREGFRNNRFSLPPNNLSDPTEKGQFSNLAGKAIADFLSKQIDGSLFTMNYEAAMRELKMPIKGTRPDLIAFRQNSSLSNINAIFAIESKGYMAGSSGNMTTHKNQSRGSIPVNFSVACVSYNIYNNIKCKYYDPINDDVKYDSDLLRALTKEYYTGLLSFLETDLFEYREQEYQGEQFYKISLSRNLEKYYDVFPYPPHLAGEFYNLSLILPKAIHTFAKQGISEEIKPFIYNSEQQRGRIYIDTDRVGISVDRELYFNF
ncbi:MAG: hypothetical protein ACLGH8_04000 [Bacteroidia bacterium]